MTDQVPRSWLSLSLGRLKVGGAATLSLLDQTIVSGSNFAFTILVARALGIEGFGAFALVWLVVLFVNSIHAAAVWMPMMTISSVMAPDNRESYLGSVLVFQRLFSLAIVTVGAMSWLVGSQFWALSPIDVVQVTSVIALYHIHEFYRRYFYTVGRPRSAIAIDLLGYILRFAPVIVLLRFERFSLGAAFFSLSAGYVAAILVSWRLARALHATSGPLLREHSQTHWRAARFLMPAAAMQWTSVNLHVTVASAVIGATAVGIVRLGQTLMNAGGVFLQSIENVLPLRVGREAASGSGAKAVVAFTRRYLGHRMLLLVPIISIIMWNASGIISLIYGPEFVQYSYVLYYLGPLFILAFVQVVVRVTCRALELTRDWFVSYSIASIFSIVVFLPLQTWLGIHGVLLGTMATYLVQLGFAWTSVRREVRIL